MNVGVIVGVELSKVPSIKDDGCGASNEGGVVMTREACELTRDLSGEIWGEE